MLDIFKYSSVIKLLWSSLLEFIVVVVVVVVVVAILLAINSYQL